MLVKLDSSYSTMTSNTHLSILTLLPILTHLSILTLLFILTHLSILTLLPNPYTSIYPYSSIHPYTTIHPYSSISCLFFVHSSFHFANFDVFSTSFSQKFSTFVEYRKFYSISHQEECLSEALFLVN